MSTQLFVDTIEGIEKIAVLFDATRLIVVRRKGPFDTVPVRLTGKKRFDIEYERFDLAYPVEAEQQSSGYLSYFTG